MLYNILERVYVTFWLKRESTTIKALILIAIPNELLGSVWIGLILLKLKIYCWNYCSKIIFKCVNSTVGPIFNEKVAKKWNLWVHEQYIMCCLRQKVNICGYCSLNSNRVLPKRVKKKKKTNKRKTQTWKENAYPNIRLENYLV